METIDTPLGKMAAVFEDNRLCWLQFDYAVEVEAVESDLARGLREELDEYFQGKRKKFQTPYAFDCGTPFQRRVWEELALIPYGETISYAELAARIGKPTACRAVAQANRANPLAILIPCHRVINADGKIGGYASGIERKLWLLKREKQS